MKTKPILYIPGGNYLSNTDGVHRIFGSETSRHIVFFLW
jgi:hypothetical protein